MVWKSTTRTCKQGTKGVRGEGGIHSMCNSNQQPSSVCTCVLIVIPRAPEPVKTTEEEEEPYLLCLYSLLPPRLYPVPYLPHLFPHVSLPALPTQSPEIDARAA